MGCKDVVTEASEVVQLSEVALQRAAGEVCFVKRCQKSKHKRIQAAWAVETKQQFSYLEIKTFRVLQHLIQVNITYELSKK